MLIAYISFFLIKIMGTGILWTRILDRKFLSFNLQGLYLVCMLGLVQNLILVLLGLPLSWISILSFLLSGIGFFLFFKNRSLQFSLDPFEKKTLIAAIPFTLIFSWLCIGRPLSLLDWDARSIWFFHSKIIYFAGRLTEQSNWNDHFMDFSHVDYPKLISGLGAQFAENMGYWNEYIPKASLIVLFSLLSLGFLAAMKATRTIIFIYPFMILFVGRWLWNGYADGFLAAFAALAHVFISTAFKNNSRQDFLCGMATLLLLPSIKNEGFALLGVTVFSIFIVSLKNIGKLLDLFFENRVKLAFFSLPFLIWSILKIKWNLNNDLNLLSLQYFGRVFERLQNGHEISLTLRWLLNKSGWNHIATVLVVTFSVLKLVRIQVPKYFYISFTSIWLYFLVLLWIYFGTPYDLNSHVSSSANRTGLPLACISLISLCFLLEFKESRNGIRSK